MSVSEMFPFLDTETGLSYAADDEELYTEIVQSYAYDSQEEELKEAYEGKDWKNFAVIWHGIKSTSLTIGATELSAKAKEMEFAGKEENVALIMEKHETYYKEYIDLLAKLRDIVEAPED